MSNSVFSLGTSRELHNINVSTINGRIFIINIFKETNGYSGDFVVLDKASGHSEYYVLSNFKVNAEDIFVDGLDAVINYLSLKNDCDSINDIHNPCNTPFIGQHTQDQLAQGKNIQINVRVN